MAGLRVLLCLGALLARQGSAGKRTCHPQPEDPKTPAINVWQGPPRGTWRGKGTPPPAHFLFVANSVFWFCPRLRLTPL